MSAQSVPVVAFRYGAADATLPRSTPGATGTIPSDEEAHRAMSH